MGSDAYGFGGLLQILSGSPDSGRVGSLHRRKGLICESRPTFRGEDSSMGLKSVDPQRSSRGVEADAGGLTLEFLTDTTIDPTVTSDAPPQERERRLREEDVGRHLSRLRDLQEVLKERVERDAVASKKRQALRR